MYIVDLQPYQVSDLAACAASSALAIGWLGSSVPRVGDIPPWAVDALCFYSWHNYVPDDLLGYHICQLCGQVRGTGQIRIDGVGVTWVMPALILHYVREHRYSPPEPFLEDLRLLWTTERAAQWRVLQESGVNPIRTSAVSDEDPVERIKRLMGLKKYDGSH